MKKTIVKKELLLEKIRANRVKHIAEYEDACKDYKILATARVQQVMTDLIGKIELLKKGEKVHLSHITFNLALPEDHTEDYDQAIEMLEMSVDDVIEIENREFAKFVRDKWEWQEEFRHTYASNKAMALTASRL